uniref:Uncharacterized protein n=1 Tax=Crocodylus porosus TaxID=8502 RepID=A0A7M4EDU2_CROPO
PRGKSSSSQRGRFISFSTWQALVVTEPTPAHHSTEKSQGRLTTYRLTEMLSRRYSLQRRWQPASVRLSMGAALGPGKLPTEQPPPLRQTHG